MKRADIYRQLANDAFNRAAEEQGAQLMAQWKVLGVRYLELASEPKATDEDHTLSDPMPWDRLRRK
jgi:hypothetical protein